MERAWEDDVAKAKLIKNLKGKILKKICEEKIFQKMKKK